MAPRSFRPGPRLKRFGAGATMLLAFLVALDIIGLVGSVYFSAELLRAAEAAGLAEMLPR